MCVLFVATTVAVAELELVLLATILPGTRELLMEEELGVVVVDSISSWGRAVESCCSLENWVARPMRF
jgi:hypothetical protein